MAGFLKGTVSMSFHVLDLTFTSSTDTHGDRDVVAALQELTNFAPQIGGSAKLVSATLIDEADQGAAVDVVFYRATGTIGAESATYAPADAVLATHEGTINFTTFDDANAGQTSDLDNINKIMRTADDSTSIFVGIVAAAATTPAAADDYKLKLGVEW